MTPGFLPHESFHNSVADINRGYFVHHDIHKASTLPSGFYRDEALFRASANKIFATTWQYIGDKSLVPLEAYAYPFTLLEHLLAEPLVLTRDQDGKLHCLSNVCTHRGHIVVLNPGRQKRLTCGYHGRCFALDGQFRSMPAFENVENFPTHGDHLPRLPLTEWGPFVFTSLRPAFPLEAFLEEMNRRIGFLPVESFAYDSSRSKDYLVNAHWALYCDNYLEGFHIPFVHKDLDAAIESETYETVLFDHGSLQIGYTTNPGEAFSLPVDHPDAGRQVAAYYFWLFPNIMFNFYPWGLSLNIVQPIRPDRTRVMFRTWVIDPSRLDSGAGAQLDKVEREDELVVENVFRGMQSSLYTSGRFSPSKEKGVHHFHRLLSESMQ